MYTSFDTERRLFDMEVEQVVAELVRDGMRLWIAIRKATEIVSDMRTDKAREREMDKLKKQLI